MSEDAFAVAARGDGVRFALQVKPRSSRSAVVGVKEGALVVALRAAPVDGAANEELVALLAEALGVRRGDVAIATGASGRRKLVDVRGLAVDTARARLGV